MKQVSHHEQITGMTTSRRLPTWRDDDRLRDECGVVAVSGTPTSAHLTSLGLYALQHRGQESCGIVALDDAGEAHSHRAMGLVSDVFDDATLARLPGTAAIGHTRYSTSGGSSLRNAQPVVVDYRHGPMAIAHNGTLTNAEQLRGRLSEEGAIFQTDSDSEAVIHLIARSRRAEPDQQVASETCALDIMGADYVREIEPGEVLRIDDGHVHALRPLEPAPHSPCLFELVYFARPDSRVYDCSVDAARRAFGRQLAREHPVEADCVFAVPDSSNSAALGYAEESGIPFELALIRNHYVGRTFIHPSQATRDFKVRVKYNPVRELIEGRRCIVVDDSLVRGTTSRGLVSLLRENGANEIHFRVASPPIISPCYYGIDMPTREELLGAGRTVPEIAHHLGVDSLGYLSLEGMKEAVGGIGPFCDACWTADYPAPLVDRDAGLVSSGAS
jgi:amidophosphoribosyltransferase